MHLTLIICCFASELLDFEGANDWAAMLPACILHTQQ